MYRGTMIWLLVNEHAEILQDFPSCKPGFSACADCAYEDAFLSRLIRGIPIQLCYPNVYQQPPRVQSRTYVFHHGHFCEDLYTLISDLYMQATDRHVATLNEVESINSGWLELLWYHLGQAGAGVGADGFVESLYEKLRAGDTSLVEQSVDKIYKRKLSPLLHSSLREWSRKHWYVSEGMADTIAGLVDRRAPGWISGVIENYANREVAAGRVRASAMRVMNFFNLGGWILGPAEPWPSAYVMVISETGVLTTLTYGPDGTFGQSKVYPWS